MMDNMQKLYKIACSFHKPVMTISAEYHDTLLYIVSIADPHPAYVCFLTPILRPSRFPAAHIDHSDLLIHER